MLTDTGIIADELVYTVVGTVIMAPHARALHDSTSKPTNRIKLKGQSTMATFLAICAIGASGSQLAARTFLTKPLYGNYYVRLDPR